MRRSAWRAVGLWSLMSGPVVLWALDAGVGGNVWWSLVLPSAALAVAAGTARRRPLTALAVRVALTAPDPMGPVDRHTIAVVVTSYLAGLRVTEVRRARGGVAAIV
ncbi:hypothetical protein [Spongiactinospora sp. TRM90649]|uniref:hypothetical protein n=1 Tax=Spongiactinospora sp. TRM90649 TaxID=3031114 RepID=UPI0023F7321E|nr:hypothetical protein [Spongiactinospora sp. TRM90649]MDF5752955.1 hypothetical protein [Spongiactinospora sp. TRM90649]